MVRRDSNIDDLGGRNFDGGSEQDGTMNWQTTCALLTLMHDHLSWTRQEDEEAEAALSAASN